VSAGHEWAVIQPDGTVGWLPPGSTGDARAITGGPAGECAIMPVTEDGRLWLMAGRSAKFHPLDYPENLLAQGVLAALSGGRARGSLRGHIALAECDPAKASFDPEGIKPLPMSPDIAGRLISAIDEAAQVIVERSARLVQDRILELRETAVTGSRDERTAAASQLQHIQEQVARMEDNGVTARDVLGMLGVVPAAQGAGRAVPQPGRGNGPRRPSQEQGR